MLTIGKPKNGTICVNTVPTYIFGVRKFLKVHKRHKKIDWEDLYELFPEKRRGKWGAYSREQIQKIMLKADPRQKVMIQLMSAGGRRVGALPYLKFRDIKALPNGLGTISIYSDSEKDYYYTFLTHDCIKTVEAYKNDRIQCYEKVTDDSFVIRDKFIKRRNC